MRTERGDYFDHEIEQNLPGTKNYANLRPFSGYNYESAILL